MKLFSLLVITNFLFSCVNKHNNPVIVKDRFAPPLSKDGNIVYFSYDSLLLMEDVKFQIPAYYSKVNAHEVLLDLQEPVLYNYEGKGEAVRLIWLRSFGHPIVIRLNNFNDTVYANIRELNLKVNSNNVPYIIKDTIVTINKRIWKETILSLSSNNFWDVSVEDTVPLKYHDGTPWFLECKLVDRYKCINRWDAGDFSSRDLNLFAKTLIEIGEAYVDMKSRQ